MTARRHGKTAGKQFSAAQQRGAEKRGCEDMSMKLTMRLGVRSYDIIIKQGGLSRVGQLINLNRRVLVVSDTGVPEAYLKTVLAQCREGVP